MSAHPRPRRPLPAPPSLVALLALVGALVGLALPAAAAPTAAPLPASVTTSALPAAATPSPSPSSTDTGGTGGTGDTDGPDVSVLVTSLSPQVVRPADELVVRARIRNETDDGLDAAVAHLRVNRFLLSTRGSVEQWADEPLDGTAGSRVATTELSGPLAPGASAEVELRVPAAALGLSTADTAWGPRGLSVELLDDGARVGIERTFVLWQPTEQPVTPTRVSVLVPLTGGPVDPTVVAPEPFAATGDAGPTDPQPTTGPTAADDDPGSTASPGSTPDGTTADAADDAEPTPEPTPGTTPEPTPGAASSAALGAPDDDDLDRLDDVLDATAAQPGVTWAADPALLVAARSPAASARARRWVDALTEAAAGREVVALPARDPDLAALAHGEGDGVAAEAFARSRGTTDPVLGTTPRTDVAWPADAVPDAATVGLVARTGATTVVVGGDALAVDRLTYTPTGRATVPTSAGDVAALVPDPVLTGELRAPTDTTAATAAQRMLAESAVITRERPNEQRHLLVTASRGWTPEPAVARAQLAALATAPWVELTGLSALIGAADPGLTRSSLPDRDVAADEIRPGEIAALGAARADLAAFAGIVADPARLLAGADDAVLAPTAVAWRVDPVQRAQVVDAVVADLAGRRTGVTAVPGSDLYLGSESGLFPLGLRNDLDQDVTVQVAVDPASPVLVIEDTQTVTITAGSEMQVRVPFRAVGSGDVKVSVTLLSPVGLPLGPAQELTVRVRADWENVGTAVVAVLLGLALVVGIIRTIRRGQTRTRGAGSTPVSEIARLPEDPS